MADIKRPQPFVLGQYNLNASNQTYTAAAAVKVNIAAEAFSRGGGLTLDGTNKRVTVARAGVYRISAALLIQGSTSGTYLLGYVYVNGVLSRTLQQNTAGSAGAGGVSGSCLLVLAASEYIEIWFESGANCTINGTNTHSYCGIEYRGP